MTQDEDVIIVEGLTKVFNHSLVAVDHIDFNVKKGEIFGFLGPNGAGKTTTIKMLITVTRPSEGKASILGGDIAKQSIDVRGAIGVVPQEYTADEALTGMENMIGHAVGRQIPGLWRFNIRKKFLFIRRPQQNMPRQKQPCAFSS